MPLGKFSLDALQSFKNPPISPRQLVQVKHLLETQGDGISLKALEQALCLDQGLCVLFLRRGLANAAASAAGGLAASAPSSAGPAHPASHARPASAIHAILVRMGTRAVAELFEELEWGEHLDKVRVHEGFDLLKYWEFNLGTAFFARALAEAIHFPQPEEAYLAGLLHDLGAIALQEVWPREYGFALHRIREGEGRLQAERAVFGFTHLEAGAEIARLWNLPLFLHKPLSDHHREGKQPNKPSHPLVDLVHLASCLMERFQLGQHGHRQFIVEARDLLGLDAAGLRAVQDRMLAAWEEARGAFDLREADLDLYARLLEKRHVRLEREMKLLEQAQTAADIRLRHLQRQEEYARSLIRAKTLEEAVSLCTGTLAQSFPFACAAFFEVDWETHRLKPRGAALGRLPGGLENNLMRGRGLLVRAALEKRALLIEAGSDMGEDALHLTEGEKRDLGDNSYLAVPLVCDHLARGVFFLSLAAGESLTDLEYQSVLRNLEVTAWRMKGFWERGSERLRSRLPGEGRFAGRAAPAPADPSLVLPPSASRPAGRSGGPGPRGPGDLPSESSPAGAQRAARAQKTKILETTGRVRRIEELLTAPQVEGGETARLADWEERRQKILKEAMLLERQLREVSDLFGPSPAGEIPAAPEPFKAHPWD